MKKISFIKSLFSCEYCGKFVISGIFLSPCIKCYELEIDFGAGSALLMLKDNRLISENDFKEKRDLFLTQKKGYA